MTNKQNIKTKAIQLNVEEGLYNAFKVRSAQEGKTIKDLGEIAIEHYLATTDPPAAPQYTRRIPATMGR